MDTDIIQVIVVFINFILGLFVFSQDTKSKNNQLFSLLAFTAAIWTLANYLDSISSSTFWMMASYSLGVIVITSGYFWTIEFSKQHTQKIYRLTIPIITTILFILSYFPGFIFKTITKSSAGEIPLGNPGHGLLIYLFFYIIISANIIWKLYKGSVSNSNETLRMQCRNILFGAFVTLFVTFISSFVLPFFSIFPFGGIDNTAFLIFLLFIAYSITKHKLFNIRVIAIELVTFTLWVFILVRILTATDQNEIYLNIGFLLITVIFGVTLIRSTLHEITQSERIERLSDELKKSYENVKTLNDQLDQITKK